LTFQELFQSEFLQRAVRFSFTDAIIAIGVAFMVGMFIYFVYKKTFSGVMYSRPFNVSLVLLSMVTTMVILAVTSDVIIALGMVGALSIVRFRTPIKDPMDLVFLFWSIAAGIIIGAGFIPLAVTGSIIIGLILVTFVSKNVVESPYIVMVNCADEIAENDVINLIKSDFPRYRMKSKTASTVKGIELILEIRLKSGETKLVNQLSAIPGVTNAAIVSYSGEYAA
jgi:uncharacterized membrane protein YhiD involved in acid resistance